MTDPLARDLHLPEGPVLIAYDGSDSARAAIEHAAAMFGGQEAIVVSAWVALPETSPDLLLAPGGMLVAAASAMGEVMEERAGQLAAEGAALAARAGLSAEARTVRGDHAHWQAIVQLADEIDAKVIVVGSRGHSAIAAAMLGSVSTGVVHHAARPVLVITPKRRRCR